MNYIGPSSKKDVLMEAFEIFLTRFIMKEY
jgi:hypothetical protein